MSVELSYYRQPETVEQFRETHPPIENSETVAYLRALLPQIEHPIILDIGMGYGKDINRLQHGGFEYVGIDSSPLMASIAKDQHREVASRIGVADALMLFFANKSVDAIWAASIYHHIPRNRIEDALKEMSRVLMNSGVAYLRIRGGGDYTEYDSLKQNLLFEHYSLETLTQLLEQAGLSVVSSITRRTTAEQDPPNTEYLEVFCTKYIAS